MASINFPDSPSVNDIFTAGDRSWRWTGIVWQTVTSVVGAQGDKGGLRYAFDTTTTMGEPDPAFLRFNSGTASSVTSIAISSETTDSVDISNFLVELGTSLPDELSVIKYYVVINGNVNGSSTNFIFAVDTIDDNGTWLELSGEYLAGVIPDENEDLIISVSRVGDLGPTGPETSIEIGTVLTSLPGEDAEVGITGPPGSQILSFTLPQGPTGPETSISVDFETGLPGGEASVTVTGPPGDQDVFFVIPQGPTGPGGVYQYNVTGPTAPTAINGEPVVDGDTWFNSETGRFYIYYDDYWVENTSSLVGPTGPSGVVWRGSYDNGPTSTYNINDIVESNGIVYICVLPVTAGNASLYFPEEGSHWELFVNKGSGDPTLVINKPTITSNVYTLTLADALDLVEIDNGATATTVFVPTDATANFPIGTQINILRVGTGGVTIAATTPGTTTINATPSLVLRAQWSAATLIKRAANSWVVSGDMA